jgi:hypothetical protein
LSYFLFSSFALLLVVNSFIELVTPRFCHSELSFVIVFFLTPILFYSSSAHVHIASASFPCGGLPEEMVFCQFFGLLFCVVGFLYHNFSVLPFFSGTGTDFMLFCSSFPLHRNG